MRRNSRCVDSTHASVATVCLSRPSQGARPLLPSGPYWTCLLAFARLHRVRAATLRLCLLAHLAANLTAHSAATNAASPAAQTLWLEERRWDEGEGEEEEAHRPAHWALQVQVALLAPLTELERSALLTAVEAQLLEASASE